jgi:hypothetical protein
MHNHTKEILQTTNNSCYHPQQSKAREKLPNLEAVRDKSSKKI